MKSTTESKGFLQTVFDTNAAIAGWLNAKGHKNQIKFNKRDTASYQENNALVGMGKTVANFFSPASFIALSNQDLKWIFIGAANKAQKAAQKKGRPLNESKLVNLATPGYFN